MGEWHQKCKLDFDFSFLYFFALQIGISSPGLRKRCFASDFFLFSPTKLSKISELRYVSFLSFLESVQEPPPGPQLLDLLHSLYSYFQIIMSLGYPVRRDDQALNSALQNHCRCCKRRLSRSL